MAREFRLSAGTPPVDLCYPATVNQLLSLLVEYVTLELDGQTFFNFGSSTPSVDDQDKPWLRLNAFSGYPQGTYAYTNGAWTKFTEFSQGMIILVPNAATVVSPWALTDGSIVNGYTTATIAADAWHAGYKTLQYVGDY